MARKNSCPICETKVRNLKRHLLEVHATGKNYAVKVCRELIDSRKGKGALRCGLCSRKYVDLTVHMLRNHGCLSKKARTSIVREAKRELKNDRAKSEHGLTTSSDEGNASVPAENLEKPATEAEQIDVVTSSDCEPNDADEMSAATDSERDIWSELSSGSGTDITPGDSPADVTGLIDRYECWLQTWVGGNTRRELAGEMASKIRRMQQYGLNSIEQFVDGVKIAEMFEELPKIKAWRPGTTTSYICAYKNFLEYLLIADMITAEAKISATSSVSRIGTAVYRARRQRDSERICEQEGLLVDGDQFEVSQIIIIIMTIK